MAGRRIVLDTETTGFDPATDEILTLSIIDEAGAVLFDEMFKPARTSSWPGAQRVNRISPQMVAHCPGVERSVGRIQRIVDGAEAVIGYNVDFDLRFLRAAGVSVERSKAIDTMRVYAKCAAERDPGCRGRRWRKLTEAAEAIGYRWEGGPHGSLADARATLAVQLWCEAQRRRG